MVNRPEVQTLWRRAARHADADVRARVDPLQQRFIRRRGGGALAGSERSMPPRGGDDGKTSGDPGSNGPSLRSKERKLSLKSAGNLSRARSVGEVAASLRARRVFDVNTVDQTFGALLHIIFLWELPEWDKAPDPDATRDSRWTPDGWVPRFRVKQLLETTIDEVTYKFIPAEDSDSRPMILAEHLLQVKIFQPMDLTAFPADCQGLLIDVEMRQNVEECELVPFKDGTPLGDVLVHRCFLKDFSLLKMPPQSVTGTAELFKEKLRRRSIGPRSSKTLGADAVELKDVSDASTIEKTSESEESSETTEEDETPPPYSAALKLTSVKDSRFGKQFSQLLLRVHIQRNHGYYLLHVAHVLFGVCLLVFSTAAYPPTDIAGRNTVDFIVLLTGIAFKQAVDSLVPNVSYTSALDRYIVACFIFLFVITAYHAMLPTLFGISGSPCRGRFRWRWNRTRATWSSRSTSTCCERSPPSTKRSTSRSWRSSSPSTSTGTRRFGGCVGRRGSITSTKKPRFSLIKRRGTRRERVRRGGAPSRRDPEAEKRLVNTPSSKNSRRRGAEEGDGLMTV